MDARSIASDWPVLVGKLPTDLASAIAALDVAERVQPPDGGIPVEKLTDGNVEEAVQSLAQTIALEDAFGKAQRQVRQALAYRVLSLAADAVPALVENMEKDFDAAVAEFRAAVEGLPDDHSAAALIQAGSSAVEAYHRAVEAQSKLKRYDGWITSLHNLPGYPNQTEKVLRLIRPSTRAEFGLLLNADGTRSDSELNPVYLAAIEADLPFALNDPASAKALADEINAMPVERNPSLRFVNW